MAKNKAAKRKRATNKTSKKMVAKKKAASEPAKKGPITRLMEEVQVVVAGIRERVTKRKARRKAMKAKKKSA